MYWVNSIHFISIGLGSVRLGLVSLVFLGQIILVLYMTQRCVGWLYYQRVEGYNITQVSSGED